MTRLDWERVARYSRRVREGPLEPWSSVMATLSSAGRQVRGNGDRRNAGVVGRHMRAARRALESASQCSDSERGFYLRLANSEIDAAARCADESRLDDAARERLKREIDALRGSHASARDELIASVSEPG